MLIGKVVGSAVASVKVDALQASKLMLVRPTDAQGNATGAPFLAIDLVGAGEDELVVVTQGSSARVACAGAQGTDRSPVDAAIVGILDSLRYYGDVVFRKE